MSIKAILGGIAIAAATVLAMPAPGPTPARTTITITRTVTTAARRIWSLCSRTTGRITSGRRTCIDELKQHGPAA